MIGRTFFATLALAVPSALAAQNVAEVQVAPPAVTIRVGERSGLLATAFDRIGNVIPTVRIIWSSNNLNVAKIDNNGTVTGVANGVAIIEARVGARRGQAAIQVTGGASAAPPPAPPAAPPAAPPPPPGPDPYLGQPAGTGPAAALRLDPGVVYLLPSESGAKLIVNKQTGQWGTKYDESQDLVRIDLKNQAADKPADQFTIAIDNGVLKLMWEDAQYSAQIKS